MRALATLLILLPISALAEMYIWTNPAGTTEAWGVPPPWYRNPEWHGHAPRTQVFLHGQLVDDTTIQLDNESAQALRNKALRQAAGQKVRVIGPHEAVQNEEELQKERKAEAKAHVDRVMKNVPPLKGMKQREP